MAVLTVFQTHADADAQALLTTCYPEAEERPRAGEAMNPARRLSKAGLAFGLCYVVLAVASGLYGWTLDDDKASTFFMQIPLVPAFWVAAALGGFEWFAGVSWLTAYLVCLPLIGMGFYLVGWALGAVVAPKRNP